MKKFIFAFIAALSFVQIAQAVPSNLGQSLLEYQAIVNSPLVVTVIPQSEFIVDIKRITKNIDATRICYEIKTVEQIARSESSSDFDENEINGLETARSYRNERTTKYKLRMLATPNPLLGPPILTVESIKRISNHSNRFFEEPEDSFE